MKAFARWLFIQTHRDELVQVKKYVLSKHPQRNRDPADGLVENGKGQGALDALSMLNLFASR